MFTSKDSLDYFFALHGEEFPFNAMRRTRHRVCCKWLIVFSSGDTPLRRQSPCHAILSSCFDSDTVQHLIVSRRAAPLPPVMGNIMDIMDTWGRMKSNRWHEEVVELLASHVHERVDETDVNLFYECIKLWVLSTLETHHFGYGLFDEWTEYFDQLWEYETKDYFDLARESISFVNDRINSVLNSHGAIIETPHDDLPSANIVESSPMH